MEKFNTKIIGFNSANDDSGAKNQPAVPMATPESPCTPQPQRVTPIHRSERHLIIERGNELITSQLSGFNISMLRILDMFLSRINARDPNRQSVTFTKAEFCKAVGLHPKTNIRTLANALHKLQTTCIVFSYETEKRRGLRSAILFTTSDISQDKETGYTTITLKSNPDLAWLFFNLQEHGYTKYALNDTIKMKHKASMLLFYFLSMRLSVSHNSNISVALPVSKVREIVDSTDTYTDFRNFRKVLDEAVSEINEYTGLCVSYTVSKQWKETQIITFAISKTVQEKKPYAEEWERFNHIPMDMDF